MRITITLGGQSVQFKVPTSLDLIASSAAAKRAGLPIHDTDDPKPVTGDPDPAVLEQKMRAELASTDALLVICALRPRLVAGCPVELEEGVLALDEVEPTERHAAAHELLAKRGFTPEAAKELRPLSETPDSSGGSMPSVSDTGDAPATSSTTA